MTSDLDVKELEIQTLPRNISKVARLRENVKKVRTEESDTDALLQSLHVLQAEVTALWDQVANLLSASDSATKRDEFVRAALRQKVIDAGLLMERESVLRRCLNALEAKLSSLKLECAALRWSRA